MQTTTQVCDHCGKLTTRLFDHDWLKSKGWKYHQQIYTHPNDYHYRAENGEFLPRPQSLESAIYRQVHMDRRAGLKKITALFGWPGKYTVREVYVVSERAGLIIANTDGCDDWGHVMSFSPGEQDGKKYDYIDKGAW